MKREKIYTVFIRTNDFMQDKYIVDVFKNNEEMQDYVKTNYPDWHIVSIRID